MAQISDPSRANVPAQMRRLPAKSRAKVNVDQGTERVCAAFERIEQPTTYDISIARDAVLGCMKGAFAAMARADLARLEKAGISPAQEHYVTLLRACWKENLPAMAKEVFAEIPAQMVNFDIYYTMLDGLAQSGDMKAAQSFLSEIPEHLVDGSLYVPLIDGYTRTNQLDAARDVFDRCPSHVANLAVYFSIIHAYVLHGLADQCGPLLQRGIDEGVFDPLLGFDQNVTIDFHVNRIAARKLKYQHEPCVPPAVVHALIEWHVAKGCIGPWETWFVVGHHTDVHATAIALESAMGKYGRQLVRDSPGVLRALVPRVQTAPRLNPDAKPFVPGGGVWNQ